jgi:hypothetical protein
MNRPITIGMFLKGLLFGAGIYVIGMILFIIIGWIIFSHLMSGGYWPTWYYNLKQRKIKRDENRNSITLGL